MQNKISETCGKNGNDEKCIRNLAAKREKSVGRSARRWEGNVH
jgi:hypothetical protein